MALKKLNAPTETKKKSSSMRSVKTAGKKSDLIKEAAKLKEEISDLEKQVKLKKAELDPQAVEVKAMAINDMIEHGAFDSVELVSEDGVAALGVTMLDKCATIRDNVEQIEKDVERLVGADNVEKILTYTQTVSAAALENPEIWERFVKFNESIKKDFNTDLTIQQLEVKKGIKELLNKFCKSPRDIEALIEILKPQINMSLK